ncbi:MAG TPA: response regulator, partial [Candidatus Saccharimonadales bacterium]|nr:response regulator [Candidatus Saccharimonadales bacterium]
GFAPALHFASNGVEVIAYFKRCLESVAGRPELPTVVVLDIKMPLMDGHQVLAWIRSQPALDGLAVCMLSDSSMDSDLATAEKNKANRYWVKPTELTQYVGLADSLKSMLHELHLPA